MYICISIMFRLLHSKTQLNINDSQSKLTSSQTSKTSTNTNREKERKRRISIDSTYSIIQMTARHTSFYGFYHALFLLFLFFFFFLKHHLRNTWYYYTNQWLKLNWRSVLCFFGDFYIYFDANRINKN